MNLAWLFAASVAIAGPEFHDEHQIAGALFLEGAQYSYQAEARWQLGESEHILFRDSHISLMGYGEVNPALVRGGPVLHFAPIAVWDITLRLLGTVYTGAFKTFLPVEDPSFSGTREAKSLAVDESGHVQGLGWRFDVRTRLKAKVGPVITMFEFELRRYFATSFTGPVSFYWEPTQNLLLPKAGTVGQLSHYLLFELIAPQDEVDRKLWMGVVTQIQGAWDPAARWTRVGPAAMWHPTPNPVMPTFTVGTLFWAETEFIPRGLPFVFVLANWSR